MRKVREEARMVNILLRVLEGVELERRGTMGRLLD